MEALRRQSLAPAAWELVVIDNASTEAVSGKVDLGWHPRARVVQEPSLGLTPARLRGIVEASGELLVFVDDDNILEDRFLELARDIARDNPRIGAFSGQAIPEFETPPEEWTRRYWGSLAIRQFAEDRWSNIAFLPETTPMGAGLCVRRQVALRYRQLHDEGRRPIRLDRAGALLVSGGDVDLAMTACDLGLGTGTFASLKLTHLMPAGRTSEEYLLRLIEGIAYSGVVLDYMRARNAPAAAAPFKTRAANVVRRLLMTPRQRRFADAHARGERRGREEVCDQLARSIPGKPA
jgi:glycosyltransferase involved in cell wall biosynthesis